MENCNYCGISLETQKETINNLVACDACFLKLKDESLGLGDTIQKITQATGLDIVAKTVANSLGFEDCGCEERRIALNEKFPYIFPKFKK
jgi:hypothetical protein